MKTIDQHIEEVMDWFDFNKVHQIMLHLNWKWTKDDGPMDVPKTAELRKHVRDKMKCLYEKYSHRKECDIPMCSGGFRVTYRKYKMGERAFDEFDVAFVLADWNTESP